MKINHEYKPIIYLVLSTIIIALLISFMLKYLLPLVIGVLIALLIDPIVNICEKRFNIDRELIVAILLIGLFCLIGYISTLLISRLTFELGNLVTTLPNYYNYYNLLFDRLSRYFYYFSSKIPEEVLEYLKANLNQILSTLTGLLSSFYSLLLNKISIIPNFFTQLIIIIIFTFLFSYFLAKDKSKIFKNLIDVLPASLHYKIRNIKTELLLSFVKFLKAQIILVLISTIITVTGFYILKVNYALLLGIICGILDIMPVFGPSLIFIPWIIFSLIIGNISFAISLIILYITIIGSRQVLQAKVIGTNMGVDPFLTLLAIYLGIEFFGFLGLFIGPFTVVIIKILIKSEIIPPIGKAK